MSTQPSAPDFGAMNLMSGFSALSFQPPVSQAIAAVTSPARMALRSASLPSQKNFTFFLHSVSLAPTFSIIAV